MKTLKKMIESLTIVMYNNYCKVIQISTNTMREITKTIALIIVNLYVNLFLTRVTDSIRHEWRKVRNVS
ncbi:hypothetical protein [Bacillus cereus]|uniref:hypothetical protein n=1 Tax=Bacillus cereus TaxID=1396 RepID=UPI001C3F3487|nr:hypothetical protein [Bacillus cereus]